MRPIPAGLTEEWCFARKMASPNKSSYDLEALWTRTRNLRDSWPRHGGRDAADLCACCRSGLRSCHECCIPGLRAWPPRKKVGNGFPVINPCRHLTIRRARLSSSLNFTRSIQTRHYGHRLERPSPVLVASAVPCGQSGQQRRGKISWGGDLQPERDSRTSRKSACAILLLELGYAQRFRNREKAS